MSGVSITDDASASWGTGSGVAGANVQTLLAALGLTTSRPCTRGVQIRAADANTGQVYVGAKSNVTTGTAAPTTDGYPLDAGEGVFLPVKDLNLVWVIGSAAGQAFNVLWV